MKLTCVAFGNQHCALRNLYGHPFDIKQTLTKTEMAEGLTFVDCPKSLLALFGLLNCLNGFEVQKNKLKLKRLQKLMVKTRKVFLVFKAG